MTTSARLQITILSTFVVLLTTEGTASAQWLKSKAAAPIPRAADGKPDLNAPAPKNSDGKPDIAGVWQLPLPPLYLANIAKDLKPGELSMQPWAEALYKHRRETESKEDPHGFCIPGGVPRSYLPPYPFRILNSAGQVVILFEAVQSYRQIFTDGRTLMKDLNPTWMGYSVGRWEGDTFVIESTGFKDESWIDSDGHPGSEELRVSERLHRRDFGHLDAQITIDDPKAYKKPWTVTLPFVLQPETELLEFICNENNRDVPHLVGK